LLSVDGDGVDVAVGMRVAVKVAVDPSLCVFAACLFFAVMTKWWLSTTVDGDRSTNK
jgi:hypothetical protein